MKNYYSKKFEINKISDGYELIYKDIETGIKAELKLKPERSEEFRSRLRLVRKLIRICVLEVPQFKNDFEIQELFLYNSE